MTTITPADLHELLGGAGDFALLDVRETTEADRGHILGATFLPRRMLELRLAELVPDRRTTLVLCDEGGPRAPLAADAALRAGYRDVRVLDGGVRGWEAAGFKLATGSNVVSKHFGEKVSEAERVPHLSAAVLQQWQSEGRPHVVCDIRTPDEYRVAHIPQALGAFGVDVGMSAADLAALGRPVVVHCAGRTRSIIACQTLRELGVGDVHALEDGTMGWTLAGLELERGPDKPLVPSPESIRYMAQRAQALGERIGVAPVSTTQLQQWLAARAAGAMNLYVFDVRQVADYEAAHVTGARTLPGGLAIQRTDEFMPVKNGQVVLIDDGEARAWITGYWLRRMGHPNVRVLAGGLAEWRRQGGSVEPGRPRMPPLRIDEMRGAVQSIAPDILRARLDAGAPLTVIDVDTSRHFGQRHVPGARWIPYGWLEARIGDAAPDHAAEIVLTCHDGVHSTYAAANLARIGYVNVSVLEGGTAAWAKADRPVETGLGGATPDDIVIPPYNSDQATMAKYLEWEKKLTAGKGHAPA